MKETRYPEPTQEAGRSFVMRRIAGEFVTLNLLRFRRTADYSATPELGGAFLIGPASQRWDLAMLVRQQSVQAFLAFSSQREYLAGIGHRMAALEDSRLLPLVPVQSADQKPVL